MSLHFLPYVALHKAHFRMSRITRPLSRPAMLWQIRSLALSRFRQLGTGDMEHHEVPACVQLDESPPIRQVSAGSDHTAILTEDGRVFVCGSNTEGQLGLGEHARSCLQLTELKFMETIAFVECGYHHTVFITTNGAVFVTGDNEHSKLGITTTDTNLYVPEVLPLDIPIKSACCGASHTFLLSMDESKILAFGSNEKGQLGMPKEVEHVTVPTEIDMEKLFDGYQLKLVACGAMHTAFVTDNGLLYTCGEARHDKLCLDDIDNPDHANEAPANQYAPKRVTAMNGFIVDNVACGGCHTLLSATKGSNADFTNNDFSIVSEDTRLPAMTELPPLRVPAMSKLEESFKPEDVTNSNIDERANADAINGNAHEETGSIDSLEANVSGSHIVNINDLENENVSTHDVPDISPDIIDQSSATLKTVVNDTMNTLNTAMDTAEEKIQNAVDNVTDKVTEKVEVVEDIIKKSTKLEPITQRGETVALGVPNNAAEVANSPPPKSPLLQDLLHVPDITQMSPVLSKHSDDGQKSEAGQSENETIPCGSDKSSPQTGKTKTQAVLPIVRSEDAIDGHDDTEHNEDSDVVVNKTPQKGRFSKLFQSIKDKENSCMGKGKVIEENITENIHKGIDNVEETVHKTEEIIETEVRNQTNSRTCTIL
ncbi:hypothetical protein evm_008107 [Chilo suppressalis]|nr:hypothetical protein evm_008107 [Chilo suppressalis]